MTFGRSVLKQISIPFVNFVGFFENFATEISLVPAVGHFHSVKPLSPID